MTVVPTMRFAQQAQADISRLSAELAELQRQISSGKSVDDLRTLGDGSTRLIATAGLISMDENRVRLGKEIEARIRLQASAMQRASSSAIQFVRTIREAALNKDGGNLSTGLEFAFANLRQAMNESFNGAPLFGGERVGDPPIKINSLPALAMVTTQTEVFDEAARKPRVDLGGDLALDVADRASEISWDSFRALRDLKRYFDAEPTVLRPRINDEQAKDLLILAEALENAVGKIQEAESRNGFKLERVEAARTQLQSRVLTLRQELSSQSETDLAAVSTRLAMLQTQYQATGQTFASLSRLTLLDFLR
ncbi:MAG: hypothetical protein KGS44_00720 [Alphaproteobacteria bacterium]|jgi:flagellin-like hook-associated protein FlgL|nr:hypothetical protein [Alphaproteobacteria bacterium]